MTALTRLALLLLALAVAPAVVQAADLSRAEVRAQRAALEAGFERDKAECESRFAVSDCLEALRLRRREALAPLVRREHELDAIERQQRAAAQRERVRERELAAQQEAVPRREKVGAASAPAASAPAPHSRATRPPEDVQAARDRAEREGEARAAQARAARQQREELARERVRLQQEQLKRQPPKAGVKPLPAPASVPGP